MKVFIAGAKGQLGQAIQEVFAGHDLFPFSHQELDISDREKVRSLIKNRKPDVVINAASYNDVEKAETEVALADAVNNRGPENLAIITREIGIPLVHVSTDYVFDGRKQEPYHEFDSINPLSVYAKSKWAGEEAVRRENPLHYIVRTAWLFHVKGDSFFKKMMRVAEKGPVRVVNDQFSSPTYAPHLAKGILALISSNIYGTYHMAGQGRASRYEEFRLFLDLIGFDIKVTPISSRLFKQVAPRPENSPLTTIQVPRILLPSWEQGVKEFVDELKLKGGMDYLKGKNG